MHRMTLSALLLVAAIAAACGEPDPTPSPTPTEAPRLAAPLPTLTPPTTVTPTNTPPPSPTPTVGPTNTAAPTTLPTYTPTPTVTPTVRPTITPSPTATPTVIPTNTPTPTATPKIPPEYVLGRIKQQLGTTHIVVKGGVVYSRSQYGHLRAVDAFTDELLWEIEDPWVASYSEFAFAVAEGRVYFVGRYGNPYSSQYDFLVAVDADTGDSIWTEMRQGIATPPVVANGVVYVDVKVDSSTDSNPRGHELHAVDALTGELLWKHTKTGGTSPVVADGVVYARAYLGVEDNQWVSRIEALNAGTGELLWNHKIRALGYSRVVVGDDVIYFYVATGRSKHNNLPVTEQHAVDASTGELLWKYETPGLHLNDSSVVDGVVYFNSYVHSARGTYLYALDASNGDLRWRYFIGDLAEVPPAVANGIAYVSSPNGRFYAIDSSSGELAWMFDAETSSFSSPLVVDDVVYFDAAGYIESVDRGGYHLYGGHHLYALDTATGDIRWKHTSQEPERLTPEMLKELPSCMNELDGHCRIGAAFSPPPLFSDGVIYVAGGDGHLYAVDTSTLP